MPAFDHGAVTIVACPDAVPIQAHHHHHGDHKLLHQPCPYASASALGALGPDWPVLAALAAVALALLLGRASVFVERHNNNERPPLRGPPIPA
jgi:hypothetical protein